MNCLFVLLRILPFIASVLRELQAFTLCPIECTAMKTCFDTVNKTTQINVYPTENDEFGKCNCQNIPQYLECLKCFFY